MYGHSEIDLKFPTPIPVNITYQTAFVDDAGKLQIRKDIYGRDAAMLSLLKGGRTRDLENMVAHAQPSYSRPPGSSLPAGVNFASDNTYFRPLVLRTAVRRTADTPPAPVGRQPQQQRRAGDHPLSSASAASVEILKRNQRSRPRARPFTLTIIHRGFDHRALFRHSRRVRLSLTWGRDGKLRLTLPL